VTTISELAINCKRKLEPIWTLQGTPNPQGIFRGNLDITGTLTVASPSDETALYWMLNNTQPLLYVSLDNGLSGTSHLKVTFRCSQAAFVKSKPSRNQVLLGFQDQWEAIAQTADSGGSGGEGPGIFTITNYQPTY
jgi:hypothetical protein